eukprot:Hpha_TRINITY_DN16152_c3_g13::TRINITY_DN16152_c3_g13_i1::g.6127::m.6127
MTSRIRRGILGLGKQGKKEERWDDKLRLAIDDLAREIADEARDQTQHVDGEGGASPVQRRKPDQRRADARGKPSPGPGTREGEREGGGGQQQPQAGRRTDLTRVIERMRVPQKDKAKEEKVKGYIKTIDALHKQNKALKDIADVTQENGIINDARYAAAVKNLKRQLDHALLQRLDTSDEMAGLRRVNMSIQDEIARLKGVAQKQAQDEKEILEAGFRKQIDAKQEELRQERLSGHNKTDEWVSKNKKRQQELDNMLQNTEAKHLVHRRLEQRNKALRVEYLAQGDDKELLLKECSVERNKNARLKDRIHELETQIAEMQTQDAKNQSAGKAEAEGLMMASLRDAKEDAGRSHSQKVSKYEEALQRHRQLLSAEVRNVQGVRAAHLAALSQRTELEVHLVEAVLARQEEIAVRVQREEQQVRERGDSTAPSVATRGLQNVSANPRRLQTKVFTAADRRRVVEELLSKERVLQLLYQQEHGTLGEAMQQDKGAGKQGDTPLVLDMNALWEKWKSWTDTARQPTGKPAQAAEEEGPL